MMPQQKWAILSKVQQQYNQLTTNQFWMCVVLLGSLLVLYRIGSICTRSSCFHLHSRLSLNRWFLWNGILCSREECSQAWGRSELCWARGCFLFPPRPPWLLVGWDPFAVLQTLFLGGNRRVKCGEVGKQGTHGYDI